MKKLFLYILPFLLLSNLAWAESILHPMELFIIYPWANETYSYSGEYKGNVRHGQGTFRYPNGAKYVGTFKNHYPNGQGVATYANGEKYVGEFKDGKKHGQGAYTYNNGDAYTGEFKAGKFYGKGTFTYSNGETRQGIWENNTFVGVKSVVDVEDKKEPLPPSPLLSCKGTYPPEWTNCQGTVTYSNGKKYIGNWEDGKQHGKGAEVYPDGKVVKGIWKDGVLFEVQ